MFELDLKLRVLPADHEVYFARPGIQYRLYSEMTNLEVVGPDLPALDFEDGRPLSDQYRLISRIERARRLRAWYSFNQAVDEPSRDLEDYPNIISGLRISQLKGVIEGYFNRAKMGDMVVVVPSALAALAHIGEFIDEPAKYVKYQAPSVYGDDFLTGRRVKWLAKIQKRYLQPEILDIVAKPNAFVLLPRSTRGRLYRLAYQAYSHGDHYSARFDVTDEVFKSYDDLIIQAFFNFVATNTMLSEEKIATNLLSFSEAAFYDAQSFKANLRTNINSPGFLNLSAGKLTPLVSAVLLALALELGPDASEAATNGTIRIGSSLAPAGDQCVQDVSEHALRQIQLLGLDRWAEACEKIRRAAIDTGLRGPAHARR